MPISAQAIMQSTVQQLANVPAEDVIGTVPLAVQMRGIVDGSVAGSTNDAVFRFASANDVFVGEASALDTSDLQVVHSATDGDSVVVRKRGLYRVSMVFSQAASSTVKLGVSADVAAGGLNSNPLMTIAGMLSVGGAVLPAATSVYHSVEALVTVSDAEAADGKVIRGHGTDGSDAVVPDATILDNTECFLSVVRVGDYVA